MTTAIELAGVGRAYGERAALAGVTLTVQAGQTLVVFGPNGAGKSTLLRVLATLLRPTAGTATVLGCELPREAWKVRGRVGLLGHDAKQVRRLLHDPPVVLRRHVLADVELEVREPSGIERVDGDVVARGLAENLGLNIQKQTGILEKRL